MVDELEQILMRDPITTMRRREGRKYSGTERHRLLTYAANIACGGEARDPEVAALFKWLAAHSYGLGITFPAAALGRWASGRASSLKTQTADLALVRLVLTGPLAAPGGPVAAAVLALGFDSAEAAMVQAVTDYGSLPPLEKLWDSLLQARDGKSPAEDIGAFACLLGIDPAEVSLRLLRRASLTESGLLQRGPHCNGFAILPRLERAARDGTPDIRCAILGKPKVADLPFDAFAHLGLDARNALALLRGALAEQATGVHLLLHGEPGTGKTTLAAALAAELGQPIYAVGEEDDFGDEPNRNERLSELRMAQYLIGQAGRGIILFDEAEDIFDAERRSRVFFHRMMESARVPVIWTANSLKAFGPAVLRRMACCVEVRVPPRAVRARLWREAAAAENVPAESAALDRLAEWLPASPGVARTAMRAARLAGGAAETVQWAVTGMVRAMAGGSLPPAMGSLEGYDPSLVNATRDLAALAGRLAVPGATRAVSLLLSGPPGSGKSAYARHLADRMGMPVVQKRASDLFGMFVGQTEAQIAAAFAEARDADAFLIFDEADSLLSDRSLAVRTWEVSQVNEMLTWMETHPLPFCCTTNLLSRVDAAAMRRFLVKAEFNFLSPAQVALAFRRFFHLDPPTALQGFDALTPADFALVRRQAELEDRAGDVSFLTARLMEEQASKPGVRVTRIGFAA